MTFDCKPIAELTNLMKTVQHFHYFEADRGFGQMPARCKCWIPNDAGVRESVTQRVAKHFAPRTEILSSGSILIDSALIFKTFENEDFISLVIASYWGRDWTDADFQLVEQVESAINALNLKYLSKPNDFPKSFFRGQIIPATR